MNPTGQRMLHYTTVKNQKKRPRYYRSRLVGRHGQDRTGDHYRVRVVLYH